MENTSLIPIFITWSVAMDAIFRWFFKPFKTPLYFFKNNHSKTNNEKQKKIVNVLTNNNRAEKQ